MAILLKPDETYPKRSPLITVDTRASWSGLWQWDRELVPLRVTRATAGQDLERCELRRVYGQAKLPHENALAAKVPKTYAAGTWVRVQAWTKGAGIFTVFVGELAGDGRDVMGSTAHGATGQQNLVAYGPLHVLRKMDFTDSVWRNVTEARTIKADWIPGVNDSKRHQAADAGNRSDERYTIDSRGPAYLYGGTNRWSNYDYLEYMLARVASASGVPWALGEGCEVLKSFYETLHFDRQQNAADVIRRLVPIRYGLEWTAEFDPAADGFRVRVFPMSGQRWQYGKAVIPANPRTLVVQPGRSPAVSSARIAFAGEHRHRYLNVIGKRIVMCCTLKFSDGTLVKGWTDSEEAAYLAGTGTPTDSAEQHDLARAADRFRNVFQVFRAAPDWPRDTAGVNPAMNPWGTLRDSDQFQNWQLSTLSWTPLKTGWDYSADPPTDLGGDGKPAEFMPPAAWIGVPKAGSSSDLLYWPVEKHGLHVAALHNDLGIRIEANPNHLLAKNHWTGAAASKKGPKWDWQNLVVTLAFETDLRPRLRWSAGEAGTTGEYTIEVPDAELWVLAADTVLSGKADGTLITGGSSRRILRSDAERMDLVMAGTQSRYAAGRARAEITAQNLWPWQSLLGYVVTGVDDGHGIQQMAGPVTQVSWQFEPSPQTTLHAGFAGGGMQSG